MRQITHFIGGTAVSTPTAAKGNVFNPCTGQVQAQVQLGTAATIDDAVANALTAQPAWAATNPQRRARVMFAWKALI